MADLELATREELIAELAKRFDTFVFAGKYEKGDEWSFRFRSAGDFAARLGLCMLMRREVSRQIPPCKDNQENS